MKYKLLVLLTFLLPISSYFLYSAFTGTSFDYIVYGDTYNVQEYEDGYVIYGDISFNGYAIEYNNSYAMYFEDGDILKIDSDYFTIYENELQNVNDIPIETNNSSKIAISIASIVAIGIVALIIIKKMDLLKTYPRASVMISLIVGTLILWGISTIVNDMLTVYVIATSSWAIYCIEYLVQQGKLSQAEAEKLQSEIFTKIGVK